MNQARNLELEAAAFGDLDDLDSWRVFADWLSSIGDTRGELANLAVHLDNAFLSERKAMTARMAELERPFVDAWHEWAQDHDLVDVKVKFKRGFAFSLEGALTQLRPTIDEIFEHEPIQRLTLTDFDATALIELLEREPTWLTRLRYLKLEGEIAEAGAAALAGVALPELRGLNLLGNELDADACPQLARLQTRSLASLTLTSNEIDDEGLAALLQSPTRGQWTHLYLSGNPLTGDAVARLAADEGLTALEGLYLRQIDANLGEFAAFADRSVLPSLKVLELPGGYWRHRDLHEQLVERFGNGLKS